MKKQDLYVAVIPNDNMELAFSILNGEYDFAIFRGSKVIMKNSSFGYSKSSNYVFISYEKALQLIKDAIKVEDEKVRSGLSKSSDNYDKYRINQTRFILNSDKALKELYAMPPLIVGSRAYMIMFDEKTEIPLTDEVIAKAVMNNSYKLVTVLEESNGYVKVMDDNEAIYFGDTYEGIKSYVHAQVMYVGCLVISLYDVQHVVEEEAKKYFSYYREMNLKSYDLRVNFFKNDSELSEG